MPLSLQMTLMTRQSSIHQQLHCRSQLPIPRMLTIRRPGQVRISELENAAATRFLGIHPV
jgi:hypothetical protein